MKGKRKPRQLCDLCSLGDHINQICFVGGVTECHKLVDGLLQYSLFQIDMNQIDKLKRENCIEW